MPASIYTQAELQPTIDLIILSVHDQLFEEVLLEA
jgi:hypothetical protein